MNAITCFITELAYKARLIPLLALLLMLPACQSLYDASMDANLVKAAVKNDLNGAVRNVTPHNATLRTPGGEEPIYFAARHGNRQMLNLFCNNGASPGYRSRQGKSLAYVAAAGGHSDVARSLVKHGGGTSSDISAGRAEHARQVAYNKKMTELTLNFAAMLMQSSFSGGSGSSSEYDDQIMRHQHQAKMDNYYATQQGNAMPYPGAGSY